MPTATPLPFAHALFPVRPAVAAKLPHVSSPACAATKTGAFTEWTEDDEATEV